MTVTLWNRTDSAAPIAAEAGPEVHALGRTTFTRLLLSSGFLDKQSRDWRTHLHRQDSPLPLHSGALAEMARSEEFTRWMNTSLEEKAKHLRAHFLMQNAPMRMVRTWQRLRLHSILVPPMTSTAAEEAFLSEMDRLLESIGVLDGMTSECHRDTDCSVDWRIDEVFRILDAEHGQLRLTLAVLAHEFRISPDYLSRLFAGHTGVHFRVYALNVRMRWAARLLSRRTARGAEVAACLGYSSPSNFIHEFKRFFGITPAQYRMLRAGSCTSVGSSVWITDSQY